MTKTKDKTKVPYCIRASWAISSILATIAFYEVGLNSSPVSPQPLIMIYARVAASSPSESLEIDAHGRVPPIR